MGHYVIVSLLCEFLLTNIRFRSLYFTSRKIASNLLVEAVKLE